MIQLNSLVVASFVLGLLPMAFSKPAKPSKKPSCRCLPSEAQWPTIKEWDTLNKTVGGRLLKTVSLAEHCYEPTYDASRCEAVSSGWAFTDTHVRDPASFTNPIYQNATDPFQTARPTSLGHLPFYSIDVRFHRDIAAGLAFAKKHNIRLTIKNTGHDFLGKSSGAGSLGLWTHNLDDVSVLDYKSKHYTGKAIKMGAGTQGFKAFEVAAKNGLRVTGGSCPSVGLAGGYTQGGGHGALNTVYGLSADQVLEWEVVTPSGQLVTATPTNKYSDLYWALSGGGAGTFGVVTSMTSRAHPDGIVSVVNFIFTDAGVSRDDFWSTLTSFHAGLSSIHGARGQSVVTIAGGSTFILNGVTFVDKDEAYVREQIAPWLADLTSKGVTFEPNFKTYPNYYEYYEALFGPLPNGLFPSAQLSVSRLVSPEVIAQNNTLLTAALREVGESGPFFLALSSLGLPEREKTDPANAVPRQWRTAETLWVTTLPWDFSIPREEMLAIGDDLLKRVLPIMERVTPGAIGYGNEGNARQADWQSAFYGENYNRLRNIKRKYDPEGLLYAVTAVGSEDWTVELDGRMCRV